MKSCPPPPPPPPPQKKEIEMYSTNNEGKSVIAERFIKRNFIT